MAVLFVCDVCGKKEPARSYKEGVLKPMWAEPERWLRRFDKAGKVFATVCSYACDKQLDGGDKKKPGTY